MNPTSTLFILLSSKVWTRCLWIGWLQETYFHIHGLLLADPPHGDSAAGPSLKNLGHWLGLQTLASDRCVSASELPVREILLNAAHKGPSVLLPVVSFVAQLLKTSAQSEAFHSSHP